MPQKSEFVCHKSRFVHHILCESPFIPRDFYAVRPLILWHILGAFLLLIWGVGVVKIVFREWRKGFSSKASVLEIPVPNSGTKEGHKL